MARKQRTIKGVLASLPSFVKMSPTQKATEKAINRQMVARYKRAKKADRARRI